MDDNGKNAGATLLQKRRKQIKVKKEETLLILRAYLSHPTNWSDILEDVQQNVDQLPEDAREHYRTAGEKQLRTRMSSKLGGLISKNPAEIKDPDIREALQAVQRLERRLLSTDGAAEDQRVVGPRDQIRQPNLGHTDNILQPLPGPAPREPNRDINQGQNRPAEQQQQHRPVQRQPQPGPVPRQAQPGPAPREVPNNNRRVPAGGRPDVRNQVVNALSSSSEDDNANARQGPRRNNRRRKRPLTELIRENHELYNQFLKQKIPKLLRDLGISSSESD